MTGLGGCLDRDGGKRLAVLYGSDDKINAFGGGGVEFVQGVSEIGLQLNRCLVGLLLGDELLQSAKIGAEGGDFRCGILGAEGRGRRRPACNVRCYRGTDGSLARSSRRLVRRLSGSRLCRDCRGYILADAAGRYGEAKGNREYSDAKLHF